MPNKLGEAIRRQRQGLRCEARSVRLALGGQCRAAREHGRIRAAFRSVRTWTHIRVLNRPLADGPPAPPVPVAEHPLRRQYHGLRCLARCVATALRGKSTPAREHGRLRAAGRAVRSWFRLWVRNTPLVEPGSDDSGPAKPARGAEDALRSGVLIGYRPWSRARMRAADADLRASARGYDPRDRNETIVLPAGPVIVDYDADRRQYARGELRVEGFSENVKAVLRAAGYRIRDGHRRRRHDWSFDRWGSKRIGDWKRERTYEDELRENVLWQIELQAVQTETRWTLQAHRSGATHRSEDATQYEWDTREEAEAYADEHGDTLRMELAKDWTTRAACVACDAVVVVDGDYVAYAPNGEVFCGTCLTTDDCEPAMAAIVRR